MGKVRVQMPDGESRIFLKEDLDKRPREFYRVHGITDSSDGEWQSKNAEQILESEPIKDNELGKEQAAIKKDLSTKKIKTNGIESTESIEQIN